MHGSSKNWGRRIKIGQEEKENFWKIQTFNLLSDYANEWQIAHQSLASLTWLWDKVLSYLWWPCNSTLTKGWLIQGFHFVSCRSRPTDTFLSRNRSGNMCCLHEVVLLGSVDIFKIQNSLSITSGGYCLRRYFNIGNWVAMKSQFGLFCSETYAGCKMFTFQKYLNRRLSRTDCIVVHNIRLILCSFVQ